MTVAAPLERALAGSRLGSSRVVWAAVTCTALVVLGSLYFAVRQPVIDDFDPAVYVASAQALADGQGYRFPAYLAAPPNTFYPPAYSVLLAGLLKLGGDFPQSLPLLQLASLLCFYGVLLSGALVLRRCYQASPSQVSVALLLAALTPPALILSTQLRSDSLFGMLALTSVLLLHCAQRRSGWRATAYLAAGGLLATLAFYTRTAGIALLAALLISTLRQARTVGARRVMVTLLPAALAVPWAVWGTVHGGVAYVRYWADGESAWPLRLTVPLLNYLTGLDISWVVAPALPLWATQERSELLPGVPSPSGLLMFPTIAFSCGLLTYAAWRSARAWWRSNETVHLFLLLYLGVLLPWPLTAGLGGRFLWPVAPLLAWYLVEGLERCWGRVTTGSGLRRLPVPALLLGALLLSNGGWLAGAVTRAASGQWAAHQAAQEKYAEMEEVAQVVRALEAPGGLATNHLASLAWWYLYTGRSGIEALARGDGHEPFYVLHEAQGDPENVTYFIYQRDNGLSEVTTIAQAQTGADDRPVILAALAARGASTTPLYCTARETFCVYDWHPGQPAAAGP